MSKKGALFMTWLFNHFSSQPNIITYGIQILTNPNAQKNKEKYGYRYSYDSADSDRFYRDGHYFQMPNNSLYTFEVYDFDNKLSLENFEKILGPNPTQTAINNFVIDFSLKFLQ